MIDLSSSLATIETSTGKVMMKNAYEVQVRSDPVSRN